jgi:hypothetical protein
VQQVNLRHNALSKALYDRLVDEHGREAVGIDRPSGNGGWVDAVLKLPEEIWLYEIKVAPTARLAIRQALGQLLEYGFLKGGWNPSKLWVVAEAALDPESETYLKQLRAKFELPIEYLCVTLD